MTDAATGSPTENDAIEKREAEGWRRDEGADVEARTEAHRVVSQEPGTPPDPGAAGE